jgi:arylsulfatase
MPPLRPFRRLPALGCALLLALSLAGCTERGGGLRSSAPRPPRHVFLVTVDTLRADHLSGYGYPRATSPELDRLAGTGVQFERAIAQWPKTGPSFASMFTGRYPQSTGLTYRAALNLPPELETLPEFFKAQGFTTLGVVSNAVLAASFGWNAGFDEYVETWGGGEHPEDPVAFRHLLSADRVNELALPLLDRHAGARTRGKAERLFVWLHYSDPHAPYILPPGMANPFLGDPHDRRGTKVDLTGTTGKQIGAEDDLAFYVAQYDANVLVTDRAIAAALAHAKKLGLLDDALVVFTADHGESLGEHGLLFEHGPLPYNTTAHVPLFFVRPGAVPAGRRIARPVELVDLYPTLRDLVAPGAAIPGLEGETLVPFLGAAEPAADQAARFERAFSEAGSRWNQGYFTSVQEQTWKLVFRRPGRKAANRPVRYELYDLAADPLETRDLAEQHPEELRRLRGHLLGWMKEGAGAAPQGEESEEQLKALKALGYVK